ncbi:hypothetical protein PHYSODRAFT_322629 [Phytophthora sojae]|uniref:Uncharacterized protein n=1 Tax=Phytophthora sojae (strain P6497) TaxID=1094619 RepID=G4YGD5_PHYSP|nr:hypothetical protein PHYSODRAFT_322629 [Phytophthora sojae]EGZ29048.1 hypothetical protein PHYSODRAFT_322629 [Phytophthora sojae]|eukprot:XP_009516323.1 hypothetical protein PHYSODRAFT_322629 [Phytophthora sojae]
MEDNWTFDDVMFYCRSLEEFNSDFDIPKSQVAWVKRFIQRYAARVPPDDGGVPSTDGGVTRGDDSEHEENGGAGGVTPGVDSERGQNDGVTATDDRVTPRDGGVTPGEDSEHKQDNSVTPGDGAVPFDGCGDEDSDEDSYDSAGSDESDSSSESMDCNESEESEYEVPTAAKKTSLPRRQSPTRSRKQKPILEWTRGDDTSWIYREGLDSLMPHQTLTESAVDYFVHGFFSERCKP